MKLTIMHHGSLKCIGPAHLLASIFRRLVEECPASDGPGRTLVFIGGKVYEVGFGREAS